MADPEPIAEHVSAVQHIWYGHGNVPSKSDIELSWKAVKAVAARDGVLSDPERLRLLGKMCALMTPPDVVEEVMQFDARSEPPERLLARVAVAEAVRPAVGAWIVYEAVSVALADGELSAPELNAVRRVGANMGVRHSIVDALIALCRQEAVLRSRRIELLNSTLPSPRPLDRSTPPLPQGGTTMLASQP